MDLPKSKIAVERQVGVGTFHATARMKELLYQVIDSGRLTSGPMMDRFEREIARLHDSRFALMCNSGTSALQIALAALKEMHGWNDGDEVLVPAVTFVATSNVVMYNGLKPVFVDVEPNYYMIDPALIAKVAETLAAKSQAAIATAAHIITDAEEFFSPNVVKVVCDANGYAHYFSRAPIPYARDAFAKSKSALPNNFPALRHIGIYAYRASFLKHYAALAPAPSEQLESLEQLRALYHGFRIAVHVWEGALAPGVDTPLDLERVRGIFAKSG